VLIQWPLALSWGFFSLAMTHFFQALMIKSIKERVLGSPILDDRGRRLAKRLMKPEGLVFERLFNFLGDLEDRLSKLEALND